MSIRHLGAQGEPCTERGGPMDTPATLRDTQVPAGSEWLQSSHQTALHRRSGSGV